MFRITREVALPLDDEPVRQTPGPHCPCLGLPGDLSTACMFPCDDHRCSAGDEIWEPSLQVQSTYCLGDFQKCPRCSPGSQARIPQAFAHREWPSLRQPAALILVAIGVIVAIAIFVSIAAPSNASNAGAELPPTTTSSATPTATSTPTLAPSPTATATPLPPTPVPPPPVPPVQQERTHLVEPGETLWGIAETYGVPLADLANRNGLTTDARISVGIELVIPGP